jgi:SdiA-regulated
MMTKLIQIKCLSGRICLLVCALTLLAGCDLQGYSSPHGYDLERGIKQELGKSLNEISGICYNTEDSSLLAVSDSRRKIIRINLKKLKLKDYTGDVVPPDQDLEDLVKLDSSLYLLSSKGLIYEVPLRARDSGEVQSYLFPSDKQNDFETLYYDASANGLVMLCKNCADDKGHQIRSAYLFNLKTKSFDTTAFYRISTADVKKILKNDDAKFDPSAAAIHPINKRLYILSSAGNLLVIADTRGKVIEAFKLNPDKYPQAEGIAFAPNGEMYITNEGKRDKPTLQVFSFQKGTK